jgi:hypothetical protein
MKPLSETDCGALKAVRLGVRHEAPDAHLSFANRDPVRIRMSVPARTEDAAERIATFSTPEENCGGQMSLPPSFARQRPMTISVRGTRLQTNSRAGDALSMPRSEAEPKGARGTSARA